MLASLAASLGALSGGAPFAGPLQNTGATSELALPGALVGAWLFATDRSPTSLWRWLGAGALAAEAFYAARAPVIAAVVALTAVLSLGLVHLERGARRRLVVLAGLALAAALLGFAARGAPPPVATGATGATGPSAAASAAPEPMPGDLAGFEVRWRVWQSLVPLVRDHPALGVGPGQFAAAYPPYRDPAEQRLSDAAVAGATSEVEHPHNDWLQGIVDLGLAGGALWLAFLGTALARALSVLRAGRAEAALAAAALGVLVNALLRSPLLANPAAAPAAFALFGALLARPAPSGRSAILARTCVLALAALLALHAREARSIVAHGRALTLALERGSAEALLAALDARPDSVPALAAAARAAERAPEGTLGSPQDARALAASWEAVLARRPHHREALNQVGKARARAGDLDGARRAWEQALCLAPADPVLLNNLMRAAAFAGDVDAALAWHARAGFEADRLTQLACALLQEEADLEGARALLDRAEPRYRGLSAQAAFDLAGQLEAEGQSDRARVLKGLAHLSWARQHVAEGDPASAVRSYRQAAASLSTATPAGARVPRGCATSWPRRSRSPGRATWPATSSRRRRTPRPCCARSRPGPVRRCCRCSRRRRARKSKKSKKEPQARAPPLREQPGEVYRSP